ncbi:DUF3892 domain-containing protein [Alicyclobacillus fodiniaquatilis]|jgi:hypothetical protein|uniref:DUF3892 domain-containing protein n=1 Tax=Alicyclobacillus fodiniaquatilis TaxID=1661150 RepID=A0ABW4JHL0_9BACL
MISLGGITLADKFEQIYADYLNQNKPTQMADDGKEKIVAVRKNDDGDIIAIRTDKGRDLDYVTALNEAKAGNLSHVDVFHKYGRDILRSEPDGIKENNLDNLPQF